MTILEGLNRSQIEAVTAPSGPVLVVAGPGTGKTLTIVRRIAYLLSKGISPEGISAITFTNRAASELRQRLDSLKKSLGDIPSEGLFVGTFHLLGLRIIKEYGLREFTIINREGQYEILKEMGVKRPGQVLKRISAIKNLMDERDDDFKEVFYDYQRRLSEKNALDLDDLILKAMELLSDEDILKGVRSRLNHLIVDEYQDINILQYKFLKTLLPENLFAVGDPDQSIYGFRGANVENFLNFKRDYPGARVVYLDRNYRNQKKILLAAESMIKNNRKRMDRTVMPERGEGLSIRVVSLPDESKEADFIISKIEEKLGGINHYGLTRGSYDSMERNYALSQFAVLYRTNSQALYLEDRLKRAGIPCYVMGRQAGEDVREALRYINENRERPLLEILEDLRKRYPFLNSLLRDYEPSDLNDLRDWLILIEPEDDIPQGDGVRLLTMHMAKGLQFRVVFITGLEEGIIPLRFERRPHRDEEDIEEERRLLYVAMTRAEEELYLLYARRRTLYGRIYHQEPSRFLRELPQEFIEEVYIPDRPLKEKQLGLF